MKSNRLEVVNMLRLETIIVTIKVVVTVGLAFYASCRFGGMWMSSDAKWSLYSAFLTVAIGLNMSLLLRRVRDGLAERFREYAMDRLSRFSVTTGKGALKEESVNFLGVCYQVLSNRFTKVTKVPGSVLAVLGLCASILIVCFFVVGIPQGYERFIMLFALPGILYYLFLAHAYCDVVVQMDGLCIDVQDRTNQIVDGNALLPEIRLAASSMGLSIN